MPTLTIIGGQTIEVDEGKRLVLAIEDSDVDILHRCGGYAKCTTCRVKFHEGEADQMTEAERARLSQQEGLLGEVRLSCQILCEHDMTVEPLLRLSTSGLADPGHRPQDYITPEPVWIDAVKIDA